MLTRLLPLLLPAVTATLDTVRPTPLTVLVNTLVTDTHTDAVLADPARSTPFTRTPTLPSTRPMLTEPTTVTDMLPVAAAFVGAIDDGSPWL